MPLTLDVLAELDEASLQREIDRAQGQLASAGTDAGRDFSRNFNTAARQLDARPATNSLKQEFGTAGRDAGTEFTNQVERHIKGGGLSEAARGGGKDAAGGFSSAFSDGVGDLGSVMSAGGMGMKGAGAAAGAVFGAALGGAVAAAVALLGPAIADGLATAVTVDLFQAKMGLDEASMGRYADAAGAAYANNFGESLADNLGAAQAALQARLISPDTASGEAQRVVEQLQGVGEVTDATAKQLARSAAVLIRTGFADSTSDALDIVTAGFQNGLNMSDDWLESINKYSTQFRKLGLDGGEVLTLLNQGMEGGAESTSAVADSLAEFTKKAVDGSKATKEGFEGLGFNADEMGRRFAIGGEEARLAFAKVLDELRQVDDPMQKALISQRLFGEQWDDMGDAINKLDLDPLKNKFTDVQDTSKRATDTATSNFKSEWDEAIRTVEQRFNDLKTGLANWFTDLPVVRGVPGFLNALFGDFEPNNGVGGPGPGVTPAPPTPVVDPNNPGAFLQSPGGGANGPVGYGTGLLDNLLNPAPGAPVPADSPLAPKPTNATDGGPQAGEHKPIDPTPDKAEKKTTPSFDPSQWSLEANPVAMPAMAAPQMGMTAAAGTGQGFGPGYWKVDPQRIFDAESGVERAKNNLEQDRIRRLELEAKGNASQRELLSIKNQIQEDERAYVSAQMKLQEAQQGTWKKQTDAANKFASSMGQIGAALDNDLGISKGLAGMADNLVRFVANLAAAPMLGQLSAVAQANGGIQRTGSGLAGFIGQQMGMGQTTQQQGYGAGYGGAAYAGGAYPGDTALLANVPAGRYTQEERGDLTQGLADCSSAVEDLVNIMDGRPTSGASMWTGNAAEWLTSRGFLPGMGGRGDFRVGFNPSHMQATLPGGTPFNWGGPDSAARGGIGGTGADDSAFTSHYYRPATGGGGGGGGGYMPVAPSVGVNPTPISLPPSGYAPLSDSALANPGLTNPAPVGPGAAPGGLPGIGAAGGGGGYGPGGTGPMQGRSYGQGAAGGGGFQGLGGAPMAALSTAAQGLDLIAPGAGQGAQIAMQLTNRAIGYAGQLAGIGVSGLLETFALNGSSLGDPSKSWIGKIAGGVAGARPALPNTAGQSAPPLAPPDKQKDQGQGQQGGGPMVNIEKFENGSGNPSDGQSAARDIARQFNSVGAGER
ncbi:phage tail tape measure protein [Mycobacteroides chelonae]|uniref:phage tail tape measure protein n=1 Tax=Mycobacteroides chelonae TaxID=1774 RepID=UPI000992F199|nr:phage tail tape measure protein [Mycobacteroides chelonae]